ncbi:interleukin-1 family member A [Solea solea]|uniref:interleukin-1 family member A n=1 Tax=Solea solea TaxID=90069 RepID=UPI00272B7E40|nr:interleukin-1 family member A [Solea solea]
MDLEDSRVHGGVIVIHKIHEGKHHYEVEKVMKPTKACGEKIFVRKGDKLIQINGMDLRGLPPKDLAQMLAEGNPMLTVHKASKASKTKIKEQPPSNGDILFPFFKDSTSLHFTMEMKRECEDEAQEGKGREDGAVEEEKEQEKEEVCPTETENGEKQDMFIVAMTETRISTVTGRGCSDGGVCEGCQGRGCTFHDVVMISESSKVTLVARGGGSLRCASMLNAAIENVATYQYLRHHDGQYLYPSSSPEKITIYHYKSSAVVGSGMPVVLNFTDSDSFLRCNKDEQRVSLQVETCSKQMLQHISMSDKTKLAYVFYMKSDRLHQRTFESALHSGWFIKIVNTETASDRVTIETVDGPTAENTFLFVIQPQ